MKMTKNIQSKREREKAFVSQMISLYCRKKHHTGKELCKECAQLKAYARERSDKCPFMETKSFCSNCKVHCYKPQMQEKIREVMRFSGPRMIFLPSGYGSPPCCRNEKGKEKIGIGDEDAMQDNNIAYWQKMAEFYASFMKKNEKMYEEICREIE